MVNITALKVDKVDRKILAELDKNCRIPSTRLAKAVGKSRQAVEYRIDQLCQKGIITGFTASFNPAKLGYRLYKLYLQLRNIAQEKQHLFTYLKNCGYVYWMGECSGSWDLIIGFYSRTDQEFCFIKNDFLSRFHTLVLAEDGDLLIDCRQYPKMYFTEKITSPVVFGGEIVSPALDEIDYLILRHVVVNARISLTELAQACHSTVAIVSHRLKKLEHQGVIIQYRIAVNLNTLGLEFYKSVIHTDRYTAEDERKFIEYVSRLPATHYFIRNLWKLELEVVVSNYQEYYHLIEGLKKDFAHVIRNVDSVLMITDEWTPGFGNLLEKSKKF